MSAAENKAVFLSYASQDAEAARRICETLRASGVEVWFDQNELVGGDAWDAKIRKQIKECALFVPIISANTQARREGYFRIEWRLAAQRTHAMSDDTAFLLPVVIDDTRDAEAKVPAEFKAVQWTRLALSSSNGLPAGDAPERFCARVKTLLEGRDASLPRQARDPELVERARRPSSATDENPGRLGETSLPTKPSRRWLAFAGVGLGIAVGLALWSPWSKRKPDHMPVPVAAAAAPLSEARKLAAKADALFDQREDASRATLDLAETFCKQAIGLDASDGEIRAIYARLHMAFIMDSLDSSPERLAAAKTQAELAVKLAPESFEARLALANYFRGQRITRQEGIRRLRELVAERPNHQRALRILGNALRLDGSKAAAEESILWHERADAFEGGDPLACYGKYLALYALGRDAEAEAALDRAIALQPIAKFVSRKAALALQRGDLPVAQEALRQIPASDLLEAEYAYFPAWVWLWSGEWQKALEAWKGIPSGYSEGSYFTGPTDYVNGLALHALGREQAAVAAWRAALQHVEKRIVEQPGAKALIGWKGVLLARLGQKEEAVRLFRSYWQIPGRAGSHFLAALNYRMLAAAIRMGAGEFGPEEIAFLRARAREYPPAALVFRHDPEFSDLRADPVFRRLVSEVAPAAAAPPARAEPKAEDGGRKK